MNMKTFRILLTAVCGIIAFSACEEDLPPIPGLDKEVVDGDELEDAIDYDKLELVWSDEFDGNSIDLTKWSYRGEGSVRDYATVDRRAVALDGEGHLLLKVLKDEETGTYYIGHVSTDRKFSATYGYFECRARVNSSVGPHIGFWLQSSDMTAGTDPAVYGAEIDIFEFHRLTPNVVHQTVHWGGYGATHQKVTHSYNNNDIANGQYHTFALKWTKSKYVYYVDGVKTWTTTQGISQHPEYIILSTELTGWGGADKSKWNFPDDVSFDYVRAYKFKQ